MLCSSQIINVGLGKLKTPQKTDIRTLLKSACCSQAVSCRCIVPSGILVFLSPLFVFLNWTCAMLQSIEHGVDVPRAHVFPLSTVWKRSSGHHPLLCMSLVHYCAFSAYLTMHVMCKSHYHFVFYSSNFRELYTLFNIRFLSASLFIYRTIGTFALSLQQQQNRTHLTLNYKHQADTKAWTYSNRILEQGGKHDTPATPSGAAL